MPTKVYTHHRNCCCIMPFVGIILYEALNSLSEGWMKRM